VELFATVRFNGNSCSFGTVLPQSDAPWHETKQAVASNDVSVGQKHDANDSQNVDDGKTRRWGSYGELERRHRRLDIKRERRRRDNINQRIQELSHLVTQDRLMTQSKPDQKGAIWSINTAGTLLRNFDVDKDLSITQSDNTSAIICKPEALPMASQTLNKDLPICIKGKKLDASADTGSDECCMPKDVADHFGLKVRCSPRDIEEFEIGDGRKIKSIGRTTVDCSFWNEPGKNLRCVFYVFERLIVPLIMGREFLESTDTLTQHQNRLVDRPPRTGLCRVMHLTRPKRRMRCYIDSELVEANPDTGVEMELVSPDFVRRKGYAIDAPDPEHEEVQFVDGSVAWTQGQVTMIFEAWGEGAAPTKARYRKFYVLDGLTTDVLLGEDLLYGINAFTEHASSFLDLGDVDGSVELKGIVWLDRAEQRLARIFGGDFSGIPARSLPMGIGKRPVRRHLFSSIDDVL
jgi:Helix-loop-helix DNA-binding domain